MLKGFKDFIMRGNVVDLAVGVVIGTAFTTLVTQLTNSFLKPLIQLMGGDTGVTAGTWPVGDVEFDWAAFVNAIITFLITAAVLYFLIVLPLNKLAERRRRGEEPPPAAPSEEIKLLTEIRDALVAGARVPAQHRESFDNLTGRDYPPAGREYPSAGR
ncbi:large conductance mechanosensitive channel protein MscL [Micromonospora sp. NBC_01796]|uniref:large conductance mechanosensitive channel protein MscL n=1 Tax=Micromonospora sp. NBC_01796 TaxID=2975987 RepID=UPI002DDC8637|nr:large conductance mechanosensitive channel protein MscL [Micromonospora sp. NBC_01796]WSA88220.1 large conductance mechanosensitive channel protein MscL [Micromonospora sp. NBC_01796]